MRNLIIASVILVVLTSCILFKGGKKYVSPSPTVDNSTSSPVPNVGELPAEKPNEGTLPPNVPNEQTKSPPVQAVGCDQTKLADCDLRGIKRPPAPSMGALEAEG